jgi:hypothetical protein
VIFNAFLSLTNRPGADPAAVYAAAWDAKAAVTHAFERPHLAAHAAGRLPRAPRLWAELSGLRSQRAALLLAPEPWDRATREARDEQPEFWAWQIASLLAELRQELPELARAKDLFAKSPTDLQGALPQGAAFIDFFRYTRCEFDPTRPGWAGERRAGRELEGVPAPALARLHGELIAFGWLEMNLGAPPVMRSGVVPQCYRATAAGRRALREVKAGESDDLEARAA